MTYVQRKFITHIILYMFIYDKYMRKFTDTLHNIEVNYTWN